MSVVLLLIALAVVTFVVVPPVIVSSSDVPDAARRLKLQNDVRTTGVQLLAGAVLAIGAIFTWRTIRVNREGQITERFTRAIDQLGSKELGVRLGGIYALERIAKDSRRDHEPIMEVLATFVREHARAVAPAFAAAGAKRPTPPPADVQAVLNVLGRRRTAHEPEVPVIDLSDTDLRSADFGTGQFQGVALSGSHLEHASFYRADLRDAILIGAHFEEATFVEADLRGAMLNEADLRKASFENANLEGAFLPDANLAEAYLGGADLRRTYLEGANLSDALYHRLTRWSEGFDPEEAGATPAP